MGKRRRPGEGTIYQRPDGRWVGQVSWMAPSGKRVRRTVYGTTQREVLTKVRALQAERERGEDRAPARLTLAAYCAQWLEAIAVRVRRTTWQTYADRLRCWVIPELGTVPLVRLTPLHCQRLVTTLATRLSPASVKGAHAALRAALADAVRWGLIPRNPTEGIVVPRQSRGRMQVWTPEQARQFLTATAGTPWWPLWALALATGARIGELLGLQWQDLEPGDGALAIRRTWTGLGTIQEPKTGRARRVLLGALGRDAIQVLRQTRPGVGSAFLFAQQHGKPPSFRWVRYLFQAACDQAGVPVIRLHDLRHTAATLLLIAGVHPKVVAEQLGHSTTVQTLDRYSHVLPVLQEQAAGALDSLLGWRAAMRAANGVDQERV